MAGLDNSGFQAKTLSEITSEILEDTARDLETTPTRLGRWIRRLVTPMARPLARLWRLGQLAVTLYDPRSASGPLLDHLAELAGVQREGATRARLTLTVAGTTGVQLPFDSLVRNERLGADFRLVSTHTISAQAVDNAVVFEAVTAGALVLDAGDAYTIQTPISGWSSVSSPTKLVDGQAAESDASLRRRRADAMAAPKRSAVGSIQRDLLALAAVQDVLVLPNPGPGLGVNSQPVGSIAVYVFPTGLSEEQEAEIARTLFMAAAPAALLVGSKEFVVIDEQDHEQASAWTYAAPLNVWIEVDLTVNTNRFPTSGGEDLVKAAVEAEFEGLGISAGGESIQLAQLEAAARCAAPGITGVVIRLDTEDPPVATTDLSLAAGARPVLQSVTVEVP